MAREAKRGVFGEVFSVIGDAYMAAATMSPRPAEAHMARRRQRTGWRNWFAR